MEIVIDQEIDRLKELADEILEEVELAASEHATIEDIDNAQELVSDLVDQYRGLLDQSETSDAARIDAQLGPKVRHLQGIMEQARP